MSTTAPGVVAVELAHARFRARADLRAVPVDRARRGAVARRTPNGRVVRAEPGPCGPLLLEAWTTHGTEIAVWGPAATPGEATDAALEACAAWVGLRDDPSPLADAVAGDSRLRAMLAAVGEVRLSRLPRVGEALARAILAQLVQSAEAHRSMAQFAALAGQRAPRDLWTWPSAARTGATASWALRRCGVSGRGARALHAGAIDDARLAACGTDWGRLDARLRALPGVGVWTSGEVRTALGDPDAVSVGDYNLPGVVGHVLAGDRNADDTAMLALLAPFAGQRGRVLQLILRAVARRVVRGPQRRAPRAALSAHRYW
jgi:3-methyladenine DNA glycosylase/8-oxoguanine DNA glycosylase